MADRFQATKTTIENAPERSPRDLAPWKVGFTRQYGPASSTTNVEWMSQGELITLWQQIGVLFNLEGMRNGLSDADIEKMGVIRK